jgi:hypothetical protein
MGADDFGEADAAFAVGVGGEVRHDLLRKTK